VFPQNNDIGCLLHGMIPSGGVLGLRLSTGFSESVLYGLDGNFFTKEENLTFPSA
jgi:hypothetical protein